MLADVLGKNWTDACDAASVIAVQIGVCGAKGLFRRNLTNLLGGSVIVNNTSMLPLVNCSLPSFRSRAGPIVCIVCAASWPK